MIARLCKLFFAAALFLNASISFAGIVIGGTRVIFPGDAPDTTISIYNKEKTLPYLIQVWVDPFDKNDGNDSNLLIVFYVQIMPDDLVMQLQRF